LVKNPRFEDLQYMNVFPYCADQSRLANALDSSNELLESQLGDDSEPMYILDGLKGTGNGMVFGNRLRRFDTRGGKKGKSIEK
jgi:hypothetical protein